jgi:hypothetical protein
MNGKEGITEFVRVRYNLPLQKDAELFEKDTEVLKKDTELFEKHQGLFASFSTGWFIFKCARRHRSARIYVSVCTYVRMSLHIRTHEPVRIYVIVSFSKTLN